MFFSPFSADKQYQFDLSFEREEEVMRRAQAHPFDEIL